MIIVRLPCLPYQRNAVRNYHRKYSESMLTDSTERTGTNERAYLRTLVSRLLTGANRATDSSHTVPSRLSMDCYFRRGVASCRINRRLRQVDDG